MIGLIDLSFWFLVCNKHFIPNPRHSNNICHWYFSLILFHPDLWVGESWSGKIPLTRGKSLWFCDKIINPMSSLLEEGRVQRLQAVRRTFEEKISRSQSLDGEILESLKEEQKICNEIERSSSIILNIQETLFQTDLKLMGISISEKHSSSNSANSIVNSNV